MENFLEVSKFIQDLETTQKVLSFIVISETSGEISSHDFDINGTNYRLISTDNGTVNLEYSTYFEYQVDNNGNLYSNSFYKPTGFFHINDDGKLCFTAIKEFSILSLKQDELFDKKQKRVIIYRSSNVLWDAIVACFSAELKTIISSCFDYLTPERIKEVASPNSFKSNWTFNSEVELNDLRFKLIAPKDLSMIQVFYKKAEMEEYPIAVYTEKDTVQIVPFLKDKYEFIKPYKIYSGENV